MRSVSLKFTCVCVLDTEQIWGSSHEASFLPSDIATPNEERKKEKGGWGGGERETVREPTMGKPTIWG